MESFRDLKGGKSNFPLSDPNCIEKARLPSNVNIHRKYTEQYTLTLFTSTEA
jgi:hypothetical protein